MKIPLSKGYKTFCACESLAINAVGATSLAFQPELRALHTFPGLTEYWFNAPIPSTESELLLCTMMAGWIFVAGALQAVINFDDRHPKSSRLAALYVFGACDLLWVFLLSAHVAAVSVYHTIGSWIVVGVRAQYMCNPDSIFERDETSSVHDRSQIDDNRTEHVDTFSATRWLQTVEKKHARGSLIATATLLGALQFTQDPVTYVATQPWIIVGIMLLAVLEYRNTPVDMSSFELKAGRIAMVCYASLLLSLPA